MNKAEEPNNSVAIELRREAFTMALYVAVCLLAALIAIPEHGDARSHVVGIIWGVTIGLALAHWFAFRLSARLVGAGRVTAEDVELGGAQVAGAAIIAAVASIPVLVLPTSQELESVEFLLAACIALAGYSVARAGGTGRVRAVGYSIVVLLLAVAIAVVKNYLAGH